MHFSFVRGTDEIEMYAITQDMIYWPLILGLDLCHPCKHTQISQVQIVKGFWAINDQFNGKNVLNIVDENIVSPTN